MKVQSTVINPAVQGTNEGLASGKMGQEQFLQLLVAQISHQDPMHPMEDRDLIAQLATFSSVEQAVETNKRLAMLQASTASQDRTALTNLIGKDVTANVGSLHLAGGVAPDLGFQLMAPATHVSARIMDANGKVVRTLDLSNLPAGQQHIAFDGRDSRGQVLADGTYTTSIAAKDAAGHEVQTSNTLSGTVTGLSFEGGQTIIKMGAVQVRPQDVVQVNMKPQSEPPSPAPGQKV